MTVLADDETVGVMAGGGGTTLSDACHGSSSSTACVRCSCPRGCACFVVVGVGARLMLGDEAVFGGSGARAAIGFNRGGEEARFSSRSARS